MNAASRLIFLSCCPLLAALALAAPARGVSPESKEVRAVIDKGFKYLSTATEGRLGGKCLIGLAFLKDGADESHPKVKEALDACLAATKGDPQSIQTDIYSTGIAAIFLCTLNPSKYNAEIVKLRDSLELRQKPCGAWGYADKETGDTSMTQYAVLSYWEMSAVGIPTSVDSTVQVADWLIRTQDPDGNWGYQGKEADKYEKLKLLPQDKNRHGMTAAGLGCTYMVGDLLGLFELEANRDSTLPPALKPVKKGQRQGALTNKIDPKLLSAAQERGRSWMRKNYKIDVESFPYYYLYALERCQSFFEASTGRYIAEPTWYNDGFDYLKKNQQEDGSFKAKQEGFDAVNTAFGVLFLLRSTKKAIQRSKSYGEGVLLAGRGLPAEVQQVRVRDGQVVAKETPAKTAELIDILANPNHAAFASIAADDELLRARIAAAEETEKQEHLGRLRKLVLEGASEARLAGVKILSRLKDVESGPTLIAALGDPDWQVVVAADEGLRFIGRKGGAALGDQSDETARAAAIERWKAWYVAIRPDAEFEP